MIREAEAVNNHITHHNLVNSVSRALDILESLGQAENGLRLTTLGQRLNLPPSTVHRLLNTLQSKGFVGQEETTGIYYLSPRILHLQANISRRIHLVECAIPYLNHLAQESEVSAHLAVLNEEHVVYLETRCIGVYLPFYAAPGRMAPAYCTGLGKVLLAQLPEEELRARIERMELRQWTANTLAEPSALLEHLQRVRQQGYAIDHGEFNVETRCVAAPIRNQHNQTIAAISVGGANIEHKEAWIQRFIPIIIANAQEISRQLGWQSPSTSAGTPAGQP
jgi:DNA-binding IclR family transcriptional regulator